ncbi:MAG: alpha/beta hydrolase fold domain-containing protein [Candidatus Binatia bacterium]|nr:alpha/beta hydrolase fold domain-containing protein [Candidatus Binatia bacterium]
MLRDSGPAPVPERFAGLAELPWFVAAATEDAWKATEWLHADTALDSARTFIGGSSAGGITAMSLAYSPDDLAMEGPAFAGVLDLWGAFFRPGDVDPGESPVFIVHGTDDRTMPFPLTETFLVEADGANLEYELHAPSGAGHGFGRTGFFEEREDGSYFDRLIAFVARQVT